MGKRVGVLLSGCGVMDGSEIHEAVLTMLALDKAGAQIICLAPNKDQQDTVNHLTSSPMGERRNVLLESARIARGNIKDVRNTTANDLDAIIIPGGYGAAKNLCTFAKDGENCAVDTDVSRLLKEMHSRGKPIGALCIAPTIIAKLFGSDHKVELTIGTDKGTFTKLEKMGARHRNANVNEIIFDAKNKIVTSACYMLATRISQVAEGAEKVVQKILEIA